MKFYDHELSPIIQAVLDESKEALFTALAQRNVCQRAGIILNKIITGLDALGIDALKLVPAAIKLIEAEGDLNGQRGLMTLLLQVFLFFSALSSYSHLVSCKS